VSGKVEESMTNPHVQKHDCKKPRTTCNAHARTCTKTHHKRTRVSNCCTTWMFEGPSTSRTTHARRVEGLADQHVSNERRKSLLVAGFHAHGEQLFMAATSGRSLQPVTHVEKQVSRAQQSLSEHCHGSPHPPPHTHTHTHAHTRTHARTAHQCARQAEGVADFDEEAV